MRDLIPVADARPAAPALVTLGTDVPSLDELFLFMRDAELRFDSLRMRLLERTWGTSGEQVDTTDVWLRHPGRAKVITRRGSELGRDFRVWIGDGTRVQTFDATADVATDRPVRSRVVGATAADLPGFARVYAPRTELPAATTVEAFIHPDGFVNRVLRSGASRIMGTAILAGREADVLRCDHPRLSHVLTDRPDHWLEVGVDRMTGLMLLLTERVAEQVTQRAEVTSLELDASIPDEVFSLRVSTDVRRIY